MKLVHEDLSTQITALCPVNQLLLVGQGQHMLMFNMEEDRLLIKLQVFTKVSVHGFHCCTSPEGSDDHLVLVWGQRCYAVFFLSSGGLCEKVIPESVAEDWIISGSWIPPSSSTSLPCQLHVDSNFTIKNPLVHSHNGRKQSSNEENYKEFNNKGMQIFILLTAHSAALVYSLHSLCYPVVAANVPETFHQVLEKLEISQHRDEATGKSSHTKWSWQSCSCGDTKDTCSVKVSLFDKFQCTDKCVLFSGCIIIESSLCNGKLTLLDLHYSSQNLLPGEVCKVGSTERNIKNIYPIANMRQMSWVCVGGTVMGDLIIWGARGDRHGAEIEPWQVIKVHKGVVFSVTWQPALHLLTTTSDDRLVKTWAVGGSSCVAHNARSQPCLESEKDECHPPKIRKSDLVPKNPDEVDPTTACEAPNVKVLENATKTKPQFCWSNCSVKLWVSCEGHDARAWRGCVVEFQGCPVVVGGGEDSRLCIWDSSGVLLRSFVTHEGASVWCIRPVQRQADVVLVTAGGDGSVKRWSLWNLLKGGQSFEPCLLPWDDVNMSKKVSLLSAANVMNNIVRKTNKFYKSTSCSPKSSEIAEALQEELGNHSSITEQCDDDEEEASLFPCKNETSKSVRRDQVGQLPNSLKAESNILENRSNEAKFPMQLSKHSSRKQLTFVRCLALVGTGHCVLTLDSGQVWLWRLPQYSQAAVTKPECSLNRVADTKTHYSTTPELGPLNSSLRLPKTPENPPNHKNHLFDEDFLTSFTNNSTLVDDESIFRGKTIHGSRTSPSRWRLVLDDYECLGGYSVVAVAPSSSTVAVCGLRGHVFVWRHVFSSSAAVSVRAVENKIISCVWLSSTELLLSVGGGGLLLYRLQSDHLTLDARFELPASKQRWFTAAVLLSTAPRCDDGCSAALLVGDRSGGLHLYTKQNAHPVRSLRNVHGSGGVTSVGALRAADRGALAVTAGRDGCLRYWRCVQSSAGVDLRAMGTTRHSGGSWVADVVRWRQDTLVLSFKEVHLGVWSVRHRSDVAQVACGGGHRAWDMCIAEGGAAGGHEDLLMVAYLKEGLPQCAYQPLCPNLQPLLTGVSSKAILCGAVLHCSAAGSVVAVAGEDNSVHLQLVPVDGPRRSLLSVVSHISAVRCMGVVKDITQLGYRQCTPPSEMQNSKDQNILHRDKLCTTSKESGGSSDQSCSPLYLETSELTDRGQSSGGSSKELESTSERESQCSNVNLESEEEQFVWFVTGGGRAQLKVWRCSTLNMEEIVESYALEMCSPVARSAQVSLKSHNDSHQPDEIGLDLTESNSGIENVIQPAEIAKVESFSTRSTDLSDSSSNLGQCGPSAAASRHVSSERPFVECVEMADCQLSHHKPSSWRHQKVQIEAEVRHMACCGMWLTATTAIVAVASSDGSLRVLRLSQAAAAPALDEVCVMEWNRCLLTLDMYLVGSWVLLLSTDTGGHVLCCVLKDAVACLDDTSGAATLELASHHQLHDMGINALATRVFPDDDIAYLDTNFGSSTSIVTTACRSESEPTSKFQSGSYDYATVEQETDQVRVSSGVYDSKYAHERAERAGGSSQLKTHSSASCNDPFHNEHVTTIKKNRTENHHCKSTSKPVNVIPINSPTEALKETGNEVKGSDKPKTVFLLTGGDDNAVVLSRLTLRPSSAGLAVDVQRHAAAVAHYSQVTGICWLSDDTFVSCSVDQRVVLWLIEGGAQAPGATLQPTRSFFSAVADIHGLLAWKNHPSRASATRTSESSSTAGCCRQGQEFSSFEISERLSECCDKNSSVRLNEDHSETDDDEPKLNESSGRIMVFGIGCETFSITK